MRKSILFLFAILIFASCNRSDRKAEASMKIKKEAIDLASDYVNGKLNNPKKVVSPDGIITTTGDGQTNYVISPSMIKTGLIDDDDNEDAIISVDYYNGQFLVLTEHLVLINTEGKLLLSSAIEADMRILGISNRIITAEVFTKSRNGPLANCHVCKEVVKYRFKLGELVRTE